MARWRLPLLSLALAACGLNVVGSVVEDLTPGGPDAASVPDGSRADAPIVQSDGQVVTNEGGGTESGADAESDADAMTIADADAGAADADASLDASPDADATTPLDAGANTEVLATGITNLQTLGRAGGFLYAGSSSGLKRSAITPNQPTGDINGIGDTRSLATDGANLLFLGQDRVGRLTPPSSIAEVNNLPPGVDIILAGTRVVASFGNNVRSFAANDFSGSTTLTPQPNGEPMGLAYDSPYVYWADKKNNAVFRAITNSAAGGSEFMSVSAPSSLAIDASILYVATAGAISYAALAAPAVVLPFVAFQPRPVGLASDATHLYWIEADSGALRRTTLLIATITETLATGAGPLPDRPLPRLIVIDASFVYWGDAASGTVYRTKKN